MNTNYYRNNKSKIWLTISTWLATRVQLHDKMLYNIQVRLNRIDHSIGTLNDIVNFQLGFK